MKKVFVKTGNYIEFEGICSELEQVEVGPSMGMVIGKAGRGKTEAARYYAVNSSAIYIRTLPTMTARGVLSEIAYEMSGVKPYRTQEIVEHIVDEMGKSKRLVIIDEADLLDIKVVETLRGINEKANCPVLLVGEEILAKKVSSRTRIASRIRIKMNFEPIQQADIRAFLKESLFLEVSSEVVNKFQKKSGGDWRPFVKMVADVERAMKASGVKELSIDLMNEVLG